MNAKIWVLLAVANIAHSRDIIVGSNDFGHKIYDENRRAGPAIWRQMENLTIATNDTEVLSKIVITDLRAEKDGDARVVEGGEGQRNVTLELKSPTALRGYEFHIEVYAVAEDQLKTMEQKGESSEHNRPKEQASTTTSKAGVTEPVNLDKQLTSTTIASPKNEASVNRRQNRDTENKDKSTQDIKSTTPSQINTAGTAEKSKEPLPNAPTSTTEKPDQKFPIVNREFQQGHTFDHPRVNIYEVNKLPESTARTIPSTNAKPEVNIHAEVPLAGGESNNKEETNVNGDKMHTHISYPKFGADGLKLSQEPVVNTDSPVVDEDKNKNVRHRRDVTFPTEQKKDTQKHLEDNAATETTPLKTQEQKHDEEQAGKMGTIVTSNPESLINQHVQVVTEKSEPNRHTELKGRHLYRRFGNAATTQIPSIPSSSEDNKTPTPKEGDSTESTNKFINSQPIQIGKELSSSTMTSDVTEAPKLGSTTETLAKSALEPKVTVGTNTIKSDELNVRHTRDTTSANKIISDSLLPPILRGSSATLKPEVNTNNAVTNANKTDTQPIPEHSEVPVVKSEETIKGTTTALPQSEEDRNTRGAIGTNGKKNEETIPDSKKDTLDLSKTIKSSNNLSEHELKDAIKPQESGKIPSENKSKDTEKSPSAESKNGEDKERKTRDTSSVDDSKKEVTDKLDAAEIKTKLQQETKLNNNGSPNLEKKSTPTIVDDKTASHDKNAQPRAQIPVWNKEDQEEASKASNSEHGNEKDTKQATKNPREAKAKENEGSKKSHDGGPLSDISLATDLNTETTEKPSVTPVAKDNKEKDVKKPNYDDTSKHTEKPE